ncbi:hypothetical protein [Streptomyces sp. RG80]|uniref:hypothetical protein n=1 Tax=Streptomyces sp. RG80 TaxID=3157340 RepID=UPI00338D8B4F
MDNGTPGAHVGEPPPSGPIELVELVIPGTGVVDREEVLRPPGVRQVSGDDSAGWYRPAEEDTDEPRTLREVYDWPRLLIGGAGRAVWLFLLPFLMINLVTWMEPRLPDRSWPGALYSFGARLLGLSLTVMLVGVFGQAVMDQIVWQCGADTAVCVSGNFAVTVARDRDTGTGLALAALAPLLVGTLMAFSARDAKSEYRPVLRTASREAYERAEVRDRHRPDRHGTRQPLEVRGFWEHNTRAKGLTTRHLCAGVLTVAMLLIVPPLQYDLHEGDATAALTVFVLTLVMAALVVIDGPYFRAAYVQRDGTVGGPRRRLRWPLRYAKSAVGGCLLVMVAAMLCCALPSRDWDAARERSRMLPGMGAEANYVVIAQGVGLVLMVVACLILVAGETGSASRTTLYGLLGPVVGVLACFTGWLYTAAFSLWLQGWLTPDGDPYAALIPRAVQVVAAAFPLVVLGGVAVGAVVAACMALRRPWLRHVSPPAPEPGDDPDDTLDNQRHWKKLRFADHAGARALGWYDRGLATLAVLVVVLTCAMYGAYWVGDGSWLAGVREKTVETLQQLTTFGAVILVGLVAVAVFAVRALVLRPEMRRNAGLAWAFGAFWPRAAHPFTPAAWAVRTVPELVHRIEHLLDQDGRRRVLIEAHSMGSVIAVAALWQVRPELRWRIALLTTGSPVGVVFRRHYPGYAPAGSIDALKALHAWVNIHRTTDVLGGPVVGGAAESGRFEDVEWKDGVDPTAEPATTEPGRTEGQPVFWPLERHLNYRRAPRLRPIRRRLLDGLAAAQPPTPPVVPPSRVNGGHRPQLPSRSE